MRLHLIIQRHELPAIRILWTVPRRSPGLSHQPSVASSFTVGVNPAASSSRGLSTNTSFNTALTSLSSTDSAYTFAQLLGDVNEVVPLETSPDHVEYQEGGGQWALEDYVVELMGSECLHFMEVDKLLRDGDELVIRPLHYEELAARQVTGRHQIAADGTHLIDGIPFGKRYLKRAPSSRPPVHIPPRNKRRRINEDGWDGNTSLIGNFAAASPGPAEIVRRSICDSSAQLEEHENADDQGSQQLIEIGHAGTETQPAGILGSPFPGSTTPPNVVDRPKSVLSVKDVKKTPRKYCVQKPRVQERHQSVLSSSSSGTDSAPSVRGVRESLQEACDETPRADDTKRSIISSSSSESSESSTSEDESSSDSEHSDEEDIEQASRDVHDDSSSTSSTSVSSSDISSSLSSSPSSNGTSSDSDVSKNKQRKPTPKTDTTGVKSNKSSVLNPPGLGSRRTRHSNLRTKLRKRLAKLKAAGVLPASANFEDLRAWDQSSAQRIAPKTEGPGLEKDENLSFKKAEFEERRAQLLRDIDAGGIDVTPKTGQLESQIVDGGNVAESPAEPISTTELPKRGKKLDLASARRFVFGSLGLRTPKSKQDVEEAKAKLAHRLKRLEPNDKEDKEEATKQLKETTTIRQALMPVENWGDFIVVKATECIYEDVKMPPPPFPFVQRWDAKSQQQIRERRNQQNPQRKKRKRKSRAYEDEGWEGHMNYERALLVYSDKEENMENVPTPAPRSTTELPGSVCEPVGVAVVEATPSQEEDGLPLLENVSSLPDATLEHMKPGAIIAFKQLEVSKTTGWEPTISAYRTGVVEQLFEDSTINIRLAKRDREHREENGESDTREYSGFDMPGYDDEQREDDGFRELELYQLMEPKLVRAAPVEHSEKNVVQATLIEDSEEVMVEETQNNGLPDRIPESVPQQPEEVEMAPPSSQTRRDISQLIEDAGFRSGLDSDLNIPDAFPSYCAPIEEEAIEEEVIVEEAIEEATIEGEALAEEVVDEEAQGQDGTNLQSDRDTPHQIPSPIFSGFGTSPQLQPTRQTPKDVTPRPTNLTSDVTTREPLSALGSSLKTSAQQVPPAGMAPSMPSDNGLCYITDLDNTALGVELGAESQFSRPKSPRRDMSRSTPPQEAEERSQASRPHSHPESHQVSEPDDQEELGGDSTVHIHGETSQADSLPLTVPQTQEQGVQSVGLGSPKSTSDYFYDLDRLLKDNDSDDSIPDFLVSSTAPPRVNAASPAKTQSQTKRHFFSSPRQRSPDPKFVYKDDDKDEDFQPGPSRTSARRKSSSVRKVIDDDFEDVGLPEPSVSRGKLRTSQKFKQEPISSQIFIPASQIPAGTQVVDLTMSSDPPIPGGGEDEDVVKSQGLPKGSGWVQKRVRRTLRRRSSLNRERDESSEPWRARTRKSVV